MIEQTALGEEIYEEYIQLDNQEKKLKERKEELRKMIIDTQKGDVRFGEITVSVSTSRTVKLKDGAEASVQKRFGDQAFKKVVDIDYLKERVEAHDLLKIDESKRILLKKAKKKMEEEETPR